MNLITRILGKPIGILFIVAGILSYQSLAPSAAQADHRQANDKNKAYAQHNYKRDRADTRYIIQLGSNAYRYEVARHKRNKSPYQWGYQGKKKHYVNQRPTLNRHAHKRHSYKKHAHNQNYYRAPAYYNRARYAYGYPRQNPYYGKKHYSRNKSSYGNKIVIILK